ncbi:MAG: division/cell wall cluster transcriptional repressor MraZ [Myxococcota bacterium]|nr:division/cell wall cluster transcriptional repressor MraZ [Myxococcota bacterium]
MFEGQNRTSIDHKGRTSVPSRIRQELVDPQDGTFILAASFDPCLEAFPAAAWRRHVEKLVSLPEHDAKARGAQRWYLGGAFTMGLDGHGRILVPPALREYAGVQREVVWVGVGGRLEIWEPDRLEKWSRQFRAESSDVAAWLAGKGL